jgi:uncharacterized membrane protein YfcA
MRSLVVLGIVGLFAQLVDGALGMAYGVTSTTLALAVGLSPATASASVHMAELGTTAVSGLSHWRFGNVDWRTVRRIGVPGAIGAFAGAVALSSVSAEIAQPWMAGILVALGVYILVRFTLGKRQQPSGRHHVRGRYLGPLGLTAGFVDATGGGGWGPVATPTLLATGKMEPRKVIGSVDTSEFLVALSASVGFLLALGSQGISWPVVAALMAGGVVAAPIAAWLVQLVTAQLLGATVGGLIIFTNSRTVSNAANLHGTGRMLLYSLISIIWAAAITLVIAQHRRNGASLTRPHTASTAAPQTT